MKTMSKKGVLPLAVLIFLFLVGVGGTFSGAFLTGNAIGQHFFPDGVTQNLTADFSNSYVSSILKTPVSTNESYSQFAYYPKQTPDLSISIGLLTVEWSFLGNLDDGVNFSTAMASSARRYFVNTGANFNGPSNNFLVDPLNDTHCNLETDENDTPNGYFCSFVIHIQQTPQTSAGIFNEVDLAATPTNHAREISVVTIEPLDRPAISTTSVGIVDYFFEKVKLVIAIWITILTYIYYLVQIGFPLFLIIGLIYVIKRLYDLFSQRRKH
jgi:hypothetical protein